MWFAILLVSFIVVTSVCLAIYGKRDNTSYDEAAVIVLGYGVKKNKLPKMLRNRLDKAVEYHGKNPDALIIVSGGKGSETKASEAEIMMEYLVSKGVDKDMIIKEEKSRTTVENLKFSAKIINETYKKDTTAALITNVFHIYRSEKYAKAAGLNIKRLCAETARFYIPGIYIRETAMLIHMFFTIKRDFPERT